MTEESDDASDTRSLIILHDDMRVRTIFDAFKKDFHPICTNFI